MSVLLAQLQRNIQTLIWKYDMHSTSIVARLPISLHTFFVTIGRATLPIYWALALIIISCIVLPIDAQLSLAGFASLMCIPIATILKLIFRRSRPKTLYAQQMKIKSYSFPSSHAYSATIAGGYFTILSLAALSGFAGYIVASTLILFIAIIGISRIHIGAHYPSDVSAGWVLGVVVLYAITHMPL
jgi:undecaprenyl-diphosphatase